MHIVFVYPPFANGFYPSPGLGSLKAVLSANGFESKIIYANLYLKRRLILFNYYESICSAMNLYIIGECVFAEHAFPILKKQMIELATKHSQYNLPDTLGIKSISISDLIGLKDWLDEYIDEVTTEILKEKPKIIGFSITFSQVNASIAIANEIKKRKPDTIIVFGGYMAREPMGQEILSIANSIDYGFSGEAEDTFLKFIKDFVSKKVLPEKGIIKCNTINDINRLPIPDYYDFFNDLDKLGLDTSGFIPFESSRGCWWGDKSHCIFCGTGKELQYRAKSGVRISSEINVITKNYNPKRIVAVDNIIPCKLIKQRYFDNTSFNSMFYEVKSSLHIEDLVYLKNNNVLHLQAGIETLNSNLLKILKKGSSALNNIRFLRDCITSGVNIIWNFLYGIPGEKDDDYLKMIEVLPYLFHLTAPEKVIPLVIQRFSPLFENAEEYNVINLRPYETTFYMYPGKTDINKISLYFKGDYPIVFKNNPEIKKDFFDLVNSWKIQGKEAGITLEKISSDKYKITDSRNTTKVKNICKKHIEVLKLLKNPVKHETFKKVLLKKSLQDEFNELIEANFIIKYEKSLLSIIP